MSLCLLLTSLFVLKALSVHTLTRYYEPTPSTFLHTFLRLCPQIYFIHSSNQIYSQSYSSSTHLLVGDFMLGALTSMSDLNAGGWTIMDKEGHPFSFVPKEKKKQE